MLTSVDGFYDFIASSGVTLTKAQENSLEYDLEDVEVRICAYIRPNDVLSDFQFEHFCKAVYAQLLHEYSEQGQQLNAMPSGITNFSVNGFSASFGGKIGDSVSQAGLCKRAKAELQVAGLTYRGVIGC